MPAAAAAGSLSQQEQMSSVHLLLRLLLCQTSRWMQP
jgi:hypothetical protein